MATKDIIVQAEETATVRSDVQARVSYRPFQRSDLSRDGVVSRLLLLPNTMDYQLICVV